jgi:hypothetical protein
MNLVRQGNRLSCSQLAAAICEGREQGTGLPGSHSSAPVTALKLGLKTIQAMRVVGNDHFDWKRAGKSRRKVSES